MTTCIRILLADDHAVVLKGVRQVLALADDFEVVGEALNGADTLDMVRTRPADLLICDISMPGTHGVDLLRRIRETHARLPVLMFTMHADNHLAMRLLQAGANGYLTKDCEPEELISAVRRTARGRRYVDPGLAATLLLSPPDDKPPHTRLSNRELEVLTLLSGGATVTAIARDLRLSAKTVSTHKSRLMQKLGLESGTDLVRYAMQHGLIR
jgi:DNA-binding NarL/FixJ family response regulator